MAVIHGEVRGLPPRLDLDLERRVQAVCLSAIRKGLVQSAHDCSDGGLAVAVAESCLVGGVGARLDLSFAGRTDALLFGETQSRIVVSLREGDWPALQALADAAGVPLTRLGRTGGNALIISVNGAEAVNVSLTDMDKAWRGALPASMDTGGGT